MGSQLPKPFRTGLDVCGRRFFSGCPTDCARLSEFISKISESVKKFFSGPALTLSPKGRCDFFAEKLNNTVDKQEYFGITIIRPFYAKVKAPENNFFMQSVN